MSPTYPPDEHLLRDLGLAGHRTPTEVVNRLPVTAGLCGEGAAGEVRLGVLGTLIDVTAAAIALTAVRPDWIATADLGLHLLEPATGDHVTAISRPLRAGARRVVVETEILDGNDRRCAAGRTAFSRIPGSATRADTTDFDREDDTRVATAIDGGRPILDAVTTLCGFEPAGTGRLRFSPHPYIANSFGTVNGGVLTLAAETAALTALTDDPTGITARDLHIHYLEQIGDGPVDVSARVVRRDRAGALCAVQIRDESSATTVAVADVRVEVPTDG